MRKVFGIILILVTMVLFFHSPSFGEPLENKIAPANFPQDLIYSQWILRQKEGLPFSSPEKAGSGNTLYYNSPIKAISEQEFSIRPEVTNTLQSPAATYIQKKEFSHFENSQLLRGKSSYDFEKIRLTGSNFDSSFNFLSSLCVAKYKEENTISWALERFKENDIFRSLAIFLELKLNF